MQHHLHLWILSAQDRGWNKIHASLSVGCVCECILNKGSLIAKCHLLGIVSPCGIVSGSEMFHLFHLKLNYIFLLLPAFFRFSLGINSEYLDFSLMVLWGCFCVINTCFGIVSSGGLPAFIQSVHFYMRKVFFKVSKDCIMTVTHCFDNTFFLPTNFIISSTGVLQTQRTPLLLEIYSLLLKSAILIH